MTDSNKVIDCKNRIKLLVGEDKYLTFMAELSGSIISFKELSRKYGICTSTLSAWTEILGYRPGKERHLLRMGYKIQQRIKAREIRTQRLIKVLFNNNLGK